MIEMQMDGRYCYYMNHQCRLLHAIRIPHWYDFETVYLLIGPSIGFHCVLEFEFLWVQLEIQMVAAMLYFMVKMFLRVLKMHSYRRQILQSCLVVEVQTQVNGMSVLQNVCPEPNRRESCRERASLDVFLDRLIELLRDVDENNRAMD